MKTLLLLLLYLPLFSAGQNINAKQVTVHDSMSLALRWIKAINNNEQLQNAGSTSIATDNAIKKYFDYAKANAVQQKALPLYWKFFVRRDVSVADSIQVQVISTDNIVTPVTIRFNSAGRIYANGQAPFRITGTYKNNNPGSLFNCFISNMPEREDQQAVYYTAFRAAFCPDTAKLLAEGLLDGASILAELTDSIGFTNGDTLINLTIQLENQTDRRSLDAFGNMVPPLKTMEYQERIPIWSATGSDYHIGGNGFFIIKNGTAVYMEDPKNVRLEVYKNHVLFPLSTPFVIPIDSTWQHIRIVQSYQ